MGRAAHRGRTDDQPALYRRLHVRSRAGGAYRTLLGDRTGSGYQAAILAELCAETYSIEYLPEVAAFGRRNLESLGYLERGVHLRVGDGYAGWPERAPFDAILVTAAPEQVPAPLPIELRSGGGWSFPWVTATTSRWKCGRGSSLAMNGLHLRGEVIRRAFRAFSGARG